MEGAHNASTGKCFLSFSFSSYYLSHQLLTEFQISSITLAMSAISKLVNQKREKSHTSQDTVTKKRKLNIQPPITAFTTSKIINAQPVAYHPPITNGNASAPNRTVLAKFPPNAHKTQHEPRRIATDSFTKAQTVTLPTQTIDKELLDSLLEDPVDCEPAVKRSLYQLLHHVTSIDPTERAEVHHYILPAGSTTNKGFQILNWFPRHKMLSPRGSFRNIQDTFCYTFEHLRNWFPTQTDFFADVYCKSENIQNDQGLRKTPNEIYGDHLHLHHLHMRRLISLFEPDDNAYLVLWGAHAQAFWDVFYNGVQTIQLKGRRVTVYRMDHPEWIGLRAPPQRLKGAIQTLKTIGRVHGVTVSTVELEAELERRIQSWADHEAHFQEARAYKGITQQEVKEFWALDKAVADAERIRKREAKEALAHDKAVADEARWIRHEAKLTQVHDRDDDVRWTRYGAEATANGRSVKQIKDVRQLGFDLIRAGYSRTSASDPHLDDLETMEDPADLDELIRQFRRAKANHDATVAQPTFSAPQLAKIFDDAYEAHRLIVDGRKTNKIVPSWSSDMRSKMNAHWNDPTWKATRSKSQSAKWDEPEYRDNFYTTYSLYRQTTKYEERIQAARLGGEIDNKRKATKDARRPVDQLELCKALLIVQIEPKTYGLNPSTMLVSYTLSNTT